METDGPILSNLWENLLGDFSLGALLWLNFAKYTPKFLKPKRYISLFYRVGGGLEPLPGFYCCACFPMGDLLSLFIQLTTVAGTENEGKSKMLSP